MNDPYDPVETALRESPYLDDGTFTEGIMGALPPRRQSPRGAVLVVSGIVAGVVGAATLGEPVTAAVILLGATSTTGVLLGGAVVALAAGALLRATR